MICWELSAAEKGARTMKYSVFISYRRDGGEYTAKMLRDRLDELGYAVFFDVESLRSGDFNTKLYSVIEECTDFILILSPDALNRCQNEDDWVRREVEYALERGKNIVPVMLRGFEFPEDLPPSMEQLRFKNGIQANTEFFEAFIQKLQIFLRTKPPFWQRVTQNTVFKRTLPVFLALLLLAMVGLGVYTVLNRAASSYPSTAAEKNLVNEALYYIEKNITVLDQLVDAGYGALNETRRYITGGSVNDADLASQLNISESQITSLAGQFTAPSDQLLEQLRSSPLETAEFTAMYDALTMIADDWLLILKDLRWLTGPECVYSGSQKQRVLDCEQIICDEDIRACGYALNEILLPVTDRSALNDFLHKYLPTLIHIPLNAASWSGDKEALLSLQDECWNKQRAAMQERSTILGDLNTAVAVMRENLIQQCIRQGMSRADAERYVEKLLAQDEYDELTEEELKQLRLREAIIQRYMTDFDASRSLAESVADELLPGYLRLRDKYTPREGDDAGVLWFKLAGLMEFQLYDWAEPCVDALEALGENGDFYADEYLPALRAFVRSVDFGLLDYGAMVVAWDDSDSINEVFQIGDIIVEINGEPCRNADEYFAVKESLSVPDYTVGVLRLNGDGELERIGLELTTDMPRVGLRSLNNTEGDDGLQS